MVVFSRDATTGELSFVETQFDDTDGVDGVRGAWSVAVSPDGEDVYVAGLADDAVAVFNREGATGALAFLEAHFDGLNGVEGLDAAKSVAVSPDGAFVYATAVLDDALTVFRRDPMSGALDFPETLFDGTDGVDGLGGAGGLAVSPDGAHVYATGSLDDALAVFAVLRLDSFLCYKARTANGQPRFVPLEVTLEGQFDSRLMRVRRPALLCAPTGMNGQALTDPNTHLEGYLIGLAQTVPPQAKESSQLKLRVVNEFGEIVVTTRKPDQLLVPSAEDLVGPPLAPDPNAHGVDHFKCYRVKEETDAFCTADALLNTLEPCSDETDCGGTTGVTSFCLSPAKFVRGTPAIGSAAAFELRKPRRLCFPSDKNGEGIKSAHAHLMCYSAKRARRRCADTAPQTPGAGCREEADCGGTKGVTSFCAKQSKFPKVFGVQLNNPFGPEVLDLRKEAEFCVPSTVH